MTADPLSLEHREARERLATALQIARERRAAAGEAVEQAIEAHLDAESDEWIARRALSQFDATHPHPLSGIEQEETG